MMNLQELFHQVVSVYFMNLFSFIYYKVKEKYIFKKIGVFIFLKYEVRKFGDMIKIPVIYC